MLQTLKAILSIMLFGIVALAYSNSFVMTLFCILSLIALWIDYTKLDKNLVLAISMSVMTVFIGLFTLDSGKEFPRVCSERLKRRVFCEVDNFLYSIGGDATVAMFYLICAALIFYWIRSKKNYKKKF